MSEFSADLHADYKTAWNALPRRERTDLTKAASKGQRSRNHQDAALTLWWIQQELRDGLLNTFLSAIATLAILAILAMLALVLAGRAPADLIDVLRWNPFVPIFVLVPFWSSVSRRPRLRLAAQLNAAVLAGETFNDPPDPEEAERLLRRAIKEGWFRGTRPQL